MRHLTISGEKENFFLKKKILKLWNRVIKEHFSSTSKIFSKFFSIRKFPGHAIIINIGIEPFIAGFKEIE